MVTDTLVQQRFRATCHCRPYNTPAKANLYTQNVLQEGKPHHSCWTQQRRRCAGCAAGRCSLRLQRGLPSSHHCDGAPLLPTPWPEPCCPPGKLELPAWSAWGQSHPDRSSLSTSSGTGTFAIWAHSTGVTPLPPRGLAQSLAPCQADLWCRLQDPTLNTSKTAFLGTATGMDHQFVAAIMRRCLMQLSKQ